ncbi:hypothetical protein L198_05197 [Cryptococcus wingfieldii CBS 7118]|uniref:Alginate lyase domain-containing protein n=1 Tax=Cryptococcus wingfieldii CBS 7118 TaxID=1295528 RepID=A0A1E3J0D5_9TREE|nr:hypothetical protein L198_05197 [Cryptococcus wingfieldii CBS 7118]ODN94340.1 hypothetical protein L198_05197 [Cryptococcus wingfieldii CBS 7118]
MTLNIPNKPSEIITPFPVSPNGPSKNALKVLGQILRKATEANEVYSVTFSEVLCPEGKNHLFSLKPYFWEVAPGKWERRDGKRNPYCDKPQGQKQLDTAAVQIHSLALGIIHLPEYRDAAIKSIQKLLTVFFIDSETKMNPEVGYAQCNPASSPLKGENSFVIALRNIILISQALTLVQQYLDNGLVSKLKEWVAHQVKWMQESEQGKGVQRYEDNKIIWYHAIIASHLAFINPQESQKYALNFFQTYGASHTPQAYFEEDLKRTRPRHYTLFALEPLVVLAKLTASPKAQPESKAAAYARNLLEFAKTVQPGKLEKPLEEGGRYEGQWQWYEHIISGWTGQGKRGGDEPDGGAWEGGWTQRMRMLWGFF